MGGATGETRDIPVRAAFLPRAALRPDADGYTSKVDAANISQRLLAVTHDVK
jgi:hypothetical protein